ncbi:ROK family transcriptional regulator [Novosphingobium profundi]|uniref:ROK family transcriptional regulator n=1 Tax=Novosphingobium profundi TaxID=1774954 RepID=UPI001BDACF2B|nr:ROK family transcriptional regulator [Novosphingobium profundi]MBT0667966.1 ROK family transcriptional regulator [Novosphingobium profundi]
MSPQPFNSRFHVINSVRRAGTISRVELVETTGLSAGSISNITRELVDHGILQEVREATEGRGRPRMALSINAQAATLAGMLLRPNGVVDVQITNLLGEALHTEHYPLASALEGEALADALADCLRRAVAATNWNLARPCAAGIGMFGTVASAAGILHWLPPGRPHPVPLQAMLESRLAIPVFIDNDANLIARSECWRVPEEAIGKRHFIQIGLGIGLSNTWEGTIQNGGRGINPEFGHVKSSIAAGLDCPCGGTGCLCLVASLWGIVSRDADSVHEPVTGHADILGRFEALAARARKGDGAATALFEQAGTALGLALANMANISNPDGATVIVEHEAWIELSGPAFHAALTANLLPFLGADFPVAVRCDDLELHPLGAIAMVQERLFQRDPLPDWS